MNNQYQYHMATTKLIRYDTCTF